MSPSLLSRRLHHLVRAGIIERRTDGTDVRYVLTRAGHELGPVVESFGAWGIRWIGELGDEDLDPSLLLWDMHRNVDRDVVPVGRTVIRLRFPDVPPPRRDWWLVITRTEVDVCNIDHGYEVAVTVTTGLRTMVRIWRGDQGWSRALRTVRWRYGVRKRRAVPYRSGSHFPDSQRSPAPRDAAPVQTPRSGAYPGPGIGPALLLGTDSEHCMRVSRRRLSASPG